MTGYMSLFDPVYSVKKGRLLMKKISLILCWMFLLAWTPLAYAQEDISIHVNGKVLVTQEAPTIVEGRTLLPVKYIFDVLGYETRWVPETRTVIGTKEDQVIELVIDAPLAYVNGQVVELDVPARIINQRTYVPVRFVAESTGALVTWDQATRTVFIDSGIYKYSLEALRTSIEGLSVKPYENAGTIRSYYHAIIDKALSERISYTAYQKEVTSQLEALKSDLGFEENTDDLLVFDQYVSQLVYGLKKDLMDKYPPSPMDNGRFYGSQTTNGLHGLGLYDFLDGNMTITNFKDSKRNGLTYELYDMGYRLGYYEDDLPVGLHFSSYYFDQSYALVLTEYKDGVKDGMVLEYRYDENKDNLYKKHVWMEAGQVVGLKEIIFSTGNIRYESNDALNPVVMRVESDGDIFVVPTDTTGESNQLRSGFGFKRFAAGVEYMGSFFNGRKSGDGYYFDAEDQKALENNLMEMRALEIIEEIIKPSYTDEMKIKAIHDYLANHVTYDTEGLYGDLAHTAYGALIHGMGVCDGYSESFKYLLDKVAIESVIIFGEGKEGHDFIFELNHAWNLIETDGVYYHYDLTWNDRDDETITYNYYQKDSAYFDDDHWWQEGFYGAYVDEWR